VAGNWLLVLLIGAGAWFFRRQGDPWQWVIAKIAGIVAASVMAVLLIAGLLAWLA
jgi:hypothetical protein